jgi:HEPN domain-containing protein
VTKTDLQKLAETRIREASVLLGAAEYDGAYYIAGYAVECALKACILKRLSDFLPEDRKFIDRCYTHNLNALLQLADLEKDLKATAAVAVKWLDVKDWDEQTRYRMGKPERDVRQFYEAITDPTDGVLQWLKARW